MGFQSDQPTTGFYKTRQTQGGPYVPVHIFDPVIVECYSDGQCQRIDRWNKARARLGWDIVPIGRVWPYCGRWPITAREYLHRLRLIQWANSSASWAPEARPGERIDLNQIPSLF